MPSGYLFRGGTVLVAGNSSTHAAVATEGRSITAVGAEAERRGRRRARALVPVDLEGGYLCPGFVDLHTHGAAGVDFYRADAENLDRAVREHYLAHGVTRLLVSLHPGPRREFLDAIARVARAIRSGAGGGVLGGLHLEGPFLDPDHPGALPVRHFQTYTANRLRDLLEAGDGQVKTMTIAPERPGGQRLIAALRENGVVAAFGHSGADYVAARRAVESGVDYVTHLFNAMEGIHHRRPGPVTAFLEDEAVRVELISDAFHVAPEVMRWVARLKAPDALCLVSDSVAPCGLKAGAYEFAGRQVALRGGRVTLPDGTLAGSALTLDRAFQVQVRDVGLDPWTVAVAASRTPARVVGWHRQIGSIAPRRRADLVVLSSDLEVRQTYLAGELVHERSAC